MSDNQCNTQCSPNLFVTDQRAQLSIALMSEVDSEVSEAFKLTSLVVTIACTASHTAAESCASASATVRSHAPSLSSLLATAVALLTNSCISSLLPLLLLRVRGVYSLRPQCGESLSCATHWPRVTRPASISAAPAEPRRAPTSSSEE
eukprot:15289-Heterococcus_DN1.PRE.1